MPLDRPNRTRAADALAAYLRGEIDNFKLDDDLHDFGTDDRSLRELRYAIWTCYDDIRRHNARASPEGWALLCRCLAFLRTDLELTYREPAAHQLHFAPFKSNEEWLAHSHLLDAEVLPAYDPARHTPPPPSWFYRGELRWHRVAIGVVVLSTLIIAFAAVCARCPKG